MYTVACTLLILPDFLSSRFKRVPVSDNDVVVTHRIWNSGNQEEVRRVNLEPAPADSSVNDYKSGGTLSSPARRVSKSGA